MHGPTPQSTDSIATAAVYVHLGPPSPLHSRLPGPSQHAPAKAAASRVAPEGAFIARAAVSWSVAVVDCGHRLLRCARCSATLSVERLPRRVPRGRASIETRGTIGAFCVPSSTFFFRGACSPALAPNVPCPHVPRQQPSTRRLSSLFTTPICPALLSYTTVPARTDLRSPIFNSNSNTHTQHALYASNDLAPAVAPPLPLPRPLELASEPQCPQSVRPRRRGTNLRPEPLCRRLCCAASAGGRMHRHVSLVVLPAHSSTH